MDVKTVFLNGNLEQEIQVNQYIGFVPTGQEDKVCHLKRSIYSLKQYLDCGISYSMKS